MNDSDLLLNDITKIINREVQDLHSIERRKEQKENSKMNREQKQTTNRKRCIYQNVLTYIKKL
jgi:hypothetical protein